MASPIAASAAATVSTNIAKTWPARSCSTTEKATKLMLTASSISSIDIMMMMTFLRLRKMPKTPEREQDRRDGQVMRQADCHRITLRVGPPAPPPSGTLTTSTDCARVRASCCRDRLAPPPDALAQRQHDRADHRDQQDQPGRLEGKDVARIEQVAERPGVGDRRRRSAASARPGSPAIPGRDHPARRRPASARPAG